MMQLFYRAEHCAATELLSYSVADARPPEQPFGNRGCHKAVRTSQPKIRSPVTVTALVGRVLAGDQQAERELYDQHVDRVYRLAYRLTGDGDLATDCTQETFIKVFSKLATFRGEAALSTWITSVAYSVIYNGLRRVKRSRATEVDLEVAEWTPATTGGAAEPDLKVSLQRAIDGLPEGYRTVFVMHDVEGYTHDEIAKSLGIQEGTSKAQLSRARAKLRKVLAAFAGEWITQ